MNTSNARDRETRSLSLSVDVFHETAPDDRPRTDIAALGVVDVERIVCRVPVAQFFVAEETLDTVPILPRRSEKEPSLGECVGVRFVVWRVRPFDGRALRRLSLVGVPLDALGLCEGINANLEGLDCWCWSHRVAQKCCCGDEYTDYSKMVEYRPAWDGP